MSTSPSLLRRPRREEGSAYIVALLVLVVLTIMGMALAMITQTEVQVGANERLINRVFYSAEATINVAIARLLVTNDAEARIYYLDDPVSDGLNLGLRNVALFHGMYEVNNTACNLCQINNAGEYGKPLMRRMVYWAKTRAKRLAPPEAGDWTPTYVEDTDGIAERSLATMVDGQPIKDDPMVEIAVLEGNCSDGKNSDGTPCTTFTDTGNDNDGKNVE